MTVGDGNGMGGRLPMRSAELPFEVPTDLAAEIDALVDAIERDDIFIDRYYASLSVESRCQEDEIDEWIQRYYIYDGWRSGERGPS